MTNALNTICDRKREHLLLQKQKMPLHELELMAKATEPTRGFAASLSEKAEGSFGLICEIKKASPSKGLIRDDFDPPSLAKAYAKGGAACLSVLTDEPYFMGADAYLKLARDEVDIPVLRKDFMVDPYQMVESRALGADCILLIMACLDDNLAAEMEAQAFELGMDVLIEVHDADELHRAVKYLSSPLIGINNRNLKTMEVSLETTINLAPLVPSDRVIVGESGLAGRADLETLENFGVRRFLIGESLMRQADVCAATEQLLKG